MISTNTDQILFDFKDEDSKLFDPEQQKYWRHIETSYIELKSRCLLTAELPQTGTHKDWIKSRVNLHVSQSLMRLLYLLEEFCCSCKNFNGVSAAALVKAMVEVPLHFGYMTWILTEHNEFEKVRFELNKVAFGNRDSLSGLTTSSKITQKVFYTRADEMMKKLFKDEPAAMNVFERLYKDANATGHHNYEARMLTGIQNGELWKAGDRKELFVFFSSKIFQFFLYCDTIVTMTSFFIKAIDHYLEYLPTFYPQENKIEKGKKKFLEIQTKLKKLSDEMLQVVQAYYLWQASAFSRSIPEEGIENAENNVKLQNKYKTFLMQAEHSHLNTFIIGISKFFDRDPRTLNIQHIIDEIAESKEILTSEVIVDIYPTRFKGEEIKSYTAYDEKDIEEIKILREKHNHVIKALKAIRDKSIAHIDIKTIKVNSGNFIPIEVEKLIIAIQQMFNKISSRFDRSETRWDHLKEAALDETRLIYENLERGEKQRIEEIKKEYGID